MGAEAAVAITADGRKGWERSWASLYYGAGSLAVQLERRGLRHGDVVVGVGASTPQTLLLLFAAWQCGAAVSLVSPSRHGDTSELTRRVSALGARAMWAPAAVLSGLVGSVDRSTVLIEEDAVDLAVDGGLADPTWPPASVSREDVAIYQATSGTADEPRLVPVTWGMLLGNLDAITLRLGLDERDRAVSWMPLYHDMGLVGYLVLSAYVGMPCTLVPTELFARRPDAFVAALASVRGTFCGSPTFGLSLMERGLRRLAEPVDLSRLVRLVCGAELIDPAICTRFVEAGDRHGLRPDVLAFAYGMAEATLAVSIRQPSQVASALDGDFALVGPPVDGFEVRVRTEATFEGAGTLGEIEVRGAHLFGGYHDLTTAQSDLDPDGWFRTGDLGYQCDGELVVVGRRKEILVLGGRNVVPDEIERVVRELPGVRTVAAIPVRGRAGESFAVLAEVTPEAAITQQDVRVALRHAVDLSPETVRFVAKGAIPRTSSGKVRRLACHALLSPDPRKVGPNW